MIRFNNMYMKIILVIFTIVFSTSSFADGGLRFLEKNLKIVIFIAKIVKMWLILNKNGSEFQENFLKKGDWRRMSNYRNRWKES